MDTKKRNIAKALYLRKDGWLLLHGKSPVSPIFYEICGGIVTQEEKGDPHIFIRVDIINVVVCVNGRCVLCPVSTGVTPWPSATT